MEIWEDDNAQDVNIVVPLAETRGTQLEEGIIDAVHFRVGDMMNAALTQEIPKVCLYWMQGRDCVSFFQMGIDSAQEFALLLLARCLAAKRGSNATGTQNIIAKLRQFLADEAP